MKKRISVFLVGMAIFFSSLPGVMVTSKDAKAKIIEATNVLLGPSDPSITQDRNV